MCHCPPSLSPPAGQFRRQARLLLLTSDPFYFSLHHSRVFCFQSGQLAFQSRQRRIARREQRLAPQLLLVCMQRAIRAHAGCRQAVSEDIPPGAVQAATSGGRRRTGREGAPSLLCTPLLLPLVTRTHLLVSLRPGWLSPGSGLVSLRLDRFSPWLPSFCF